MTMTAGGRDQSERPHVLGVDVDPQTRCSHYQSALDVIAIKLQCCGEYYACKECHDALADHELAPWPRDEFDLKAVLCGVCGSELSIDAYLGCDNSCPACGAGFNPGCRHHHPFYFAAD